MKHGVLALVGLAVIAAVIWLFASDGVGPQGPIEADDRVQASDPSAGVVEGRDSTVSSRSSVAGDSVDVLATGDAGAGPDESDVDGYGLRVMVESREGSRLADVVVWVQRKHVVAKWAERRGARTDEDGVAEFRGLTEAEVRVGTSIGGWRFVKLAPGVMTETVFRLHRGVDVRGRVVDDAAVPVAGAAIWMSDRFSVSRGEEVARTDEDGRFELPSVDDPRFYSARADGFLPSPRFRHDPNLNEAELLIQLVRGRVATIAGRVTDHDARPVAGARVLVGSDSSTERRRVADGSWAPRPPPRYVETDASGEFSVTGLASGPTVVQARSAGFGTSRIEVELVADVTTRCEVVLETEATVEGLVLLDGVPQPGVLLSAESEAFAGTATQSDRTGHYRLEGLSSGDLEISATGKGGKARFVLELVAGVDYEHDVELRPTEDVDPNAFVLRGRAPEGAGRWTPAWSITVFRSGSVAGQRIDAMSEVDGTFEIAVPWQRVAVSARMRSQPEGFAPFFIDDFDVMSGELEITMDDARRRTGSIVGKVVDVDGQPCEARVEVWHERERHFASLNNDSGNGVFEFEFVHPGPNRIVVHCRRHPWITIGTKTISAGQRLDLGELRAVEGGSIEGLVTVSAGNLPASLEFALIRDGMQAGVVEFANQTFRSNSLAPGDGYLLDVRGAGVRSQTVPVSIVAGETTRIDLELQPAAVRELAFQWTDGERPAWFSVTARDRDSGETVWSGGPPHGSDHVTASLPIGEFEIVVWGPNSVQLGVFGLTVASLAPRDAVVYRVR